MQNIQGIEVMQVIHNLEAEAIQAKGFGEQHHQEVCEEKQEIYDRMPFQHYKDLVKVCSQACILMFNDLAVCSEDIKPNDEAWQNTFFLACKLRGGIEQVMEVLQTQSQTVHLRSDLEKALEVVDRIGSDLRPFISNNTWKEKAPSYCWSQGLKDPSKWFGVTSEAIEFANQDENKEKQGFIATKAAKLFQLLRG